MIAISNCMKAHGIPLDEDCLNEEVKHVFAEYGSVGEDGASQLTFDEFLTAVHEVEDQLPMCEP